jgi:3-phosphoshikimate 1-carboxyvinyltransferase
MNINLSYSKIKSNSEIIITGSKSETNRLLLLQALFPEISLKNTSNSDDSEVMIKALTQIPNSQFPIPKFLTIDVHHAGTAMRFLTAYFAVQPNCEVVLTGSSRMKERPIHILVEALNRLGAQISYEENQGFPPLRIKGRVVEGNEISIQANTSSQFISALLLIAPTLKNGLKLHLEGEITSLPYINMTLALLKEIGTETTFETNSINIKPLTYNLEPTSLTIESDWSSASYFYSIVALSEIGTQITLSSYKKDSLQGDAVLSEIYKDFGVETVFNANESITITKVNGTFNGNGTFNDKIQYQTQPTTHNSQPTTYNTETTTDNPQPTTYNLQHSPDIAQTIAVTCFGLEMSCHLTGLHTLKIKETDRLQALKNELEKLGAFVTISNDSLTMQPGTGIIENVTIKTYQDHRMAMAFAPLALKTGLIIEDAEVVSKSYPDFWKDLKSCGIESC